MYPCDLLYRYILARGGPKNPYAVNSRARAARFHLLALAPDSESWWEANR